MGGIKLLTKKKKREGKGRDERLGVGESISRRDEISSAATQISYKKIALHLRRYFPEQIPAN